MCGSGVHVDGSCNESGRELDHIPTREAAELTPETAARERTSDIVVHLPDGRTDRNVRFCAEDVQ
jgi:hypothetical protein